MGEEWVKRHNAKVVAQARSSSEPVAQVPVDISTGGKHDEKNKNTNTSSHNKRYELEVDSDKSYDELAR